MAIITSNLKQAITLLNAGEVVAIPTETVYGLAANALSAEAVNKIYSIKQRPTYNPLIVHVGYKKDIFKYANAVHPYATKLMDAFWPGPLTILFDKKSNIPMEVTSGLPKVAIRMPKHQLLLSLLRELNYPLAAPSANLFGRVSPTKSSHVQMQLGDKIPLILEGGECECGLESTIVGVEDNVVKIYRLGFITEEQICETLGSNVVIEHQNESKPLAPGMLPFHYSTITPLILDDNLENHLYNLRDKNIGIVSFSKVYDVMEHSYTLSLNGNLEESAHQLYATLSHLDGLNLDVILCEKFPDYGLGKTINDRLTKASNKHNELQLTFREPN